MWLPASMPLDGMQIKISAGNAELTGDMPECRHIELTTGAGRIRAASLKAAEHLLMEIGAGAIELSRVQTKDIRAECGMGKIELNIR